MSAGPAHTQYIAHKVVSIEAQNHAGILDYISFHNYPTEARVELQVNLDRMKNTPTSNYWDIINSYGTTLTTFGTVYADPNGRLVLTLNSKSLLPSVLKTLHTNFGVDVSSADEMRIYKVSGLAYPGGDSITALASAGKTLEIEKLLRTGKLKVNEKDAQGDDALHIAFRCKNKYLGETLLKNHAYIDSKDSNGKTILRLAVEAGDYEWFKLAMKHHANTYQKDSTYNDNLLHTAVKAFKNLVNIKKTADSHTKSSLTTKENEYKTIIKDLAKENKYLATEKNYDDKTPKDIAGEVYEDLSVWLHLSTANNWWND